MDDVGVDSIEVAVAIATAMEGGLIPWGDGKAALEIVKQMAEPTPLARIIAGGCAVVGKLCGLYRVPVVKDQAIPAYDPRPIKGIGLTYATTPMGADHTAGYCISGNVLKIGANIDPLKKDGQIEYSRAMQIGTAAVDSTGMCLFVYFGIADNPDGYQALIDMINAQYGLSLTAEDVDKLGETVLKLERILIRVQDLPMPMTVCLNLWSMSHYHPTMWFGILHRKRLIKCIIFNSDSL